MIRSILSISLVFAMLLISSGATLGSIPLVEMNEEVENVLEDSMEKEALIEEIKLMTSDGSLNAHEYHQLHLSEEMPLCEYSEIDSPPPELS